MFQNLFRDNFDILTFFFFLNEKSIRINKKKNHPYRDGNTGPLCIRTLRERKIESVENPDASAQCNVDIEYTRLVLRNAHRRIELTAAAFDPGNLYIYLRSVTTTDGYIISVFGKDRFYTSLSSLLYISKKISFLSSHMSL